MGLMDVLNGMANGPRGPAEPGKRGGISPITMGLLALLAYKPCLALARPASSFAQYTAHRSFACGPPARVRAQAH